MFNIVYHHLVVSKDIPKLSSEWKEKIRQAIEQRLTIPPIFMANPCGAR